MGGGRRPLVAGNWKMNGLLAAVAELDLMIAGAAAIPGTDLLVCPPATLIATFASRARGSGVAIGAQDCHAERAGAFTGDISAEMLKDAGASAVIVGHSERRSIITSAMLTSAPRPWRRAGLACCQSCAWAKRDQNAMPAGRCRSSRSSLRGRCRMARSPGPGCGVRTGLGNRYRSHSDAGRCGRDARPYPQASDRDSARQGRASASFMAARSSRRMRRTHEDRQRRRCPCRGASLKAEDFLAIAAVYR